MIELAWAIVITLSLFTLVPLLGMGLGGETYVESIFIGIAGCMAMGIVVLIVGSGSWAISTLLEYYEVTLL